MTSSDAMFAIIYGTAGLVDVLEGDTRLTAFQKAKLTAIKAHAAGNSTNREEDLFTAAMVKTLMNKVRAYG